LYPESC